jgi:hypothetical protein
MKRNAMNIINDTKEAFPGCISPVLDLISSMIGIDPVMSIIAKRTIKDAKISIRLMCMVLNLVQR